jgi:Protein of unknown function (DUF3119)
MVKLLLFYLLLALSGLAGECFTARISKIQHTSWRDGQVRNRNVGIYGKQSSQLNAFFGDFFKPKTAEPKIPITPQYDPVTIDPDFRIAGAFLVLGLILDIIPYIQLTLGPLVTALGILFLVQTFRVRFVFDENNCIELQTTTSPDKSSGENVIVGGANKWDCNTIVNYDFFPKGWIDSSPTGPVLVYFKETQTPSDTWNQGPGKAANDPAKIEAGQAIAGQVHFFPAICNANQIREEFEKRGCRRL